MSEHHKTLARRYFEELWSRGGLAVADEILSPDFYFHGPGVRIHGAESFKQFVSLFRTSFPDLMFADQEYIAEGDRVASCFTTSGTHYSTFQGIPPTGYQVTVPGMHVFHITGGKIADIRVSMDTLGMLQQLGVLPEPGDDVPAPIQYVGSETGGTRWNTARLSSESWSTNGPSGARRSSEHRSGPPSWWPGPSWQPPGFSWRSGPGTRWRIW